MNFKDYCDLILTLVNKVDSMWNYFFTANGAIVVWLVSAKDEIPLSYRIFAIIIYTSYLVTSFFSHIRAYRFLNLALNEFRLNLDRIDFKATDLPEKVDNLRYNNRYTLVLFTYLLAGVVVNFTLWIGGFTST